MAIRFIKPNVHLTGLRAVTFIVVAAASGLASAGGIKAQTTTCKLEKVKDNQRSGMTAFTVLVPKGWENTNTLKWRPDNSFYLEFLSDADDKRYMVDVVGPVPVFYNSHTGGQTTGTKLSSATDYLHSIITRIQDQLGASNIQVLDEVNKDLPLTMFQTASPDLAPGEQIPATHFRQAGFLKIGFERNGVSEIGYFATTVAANDKIGHSRFGIGRGAVWDNDNMDAVAGPTTFIMVPQNSNPQRVKEAKIVASTPAATPQFSDFCARLTTAIVQGGETYLRKTGIAQQQMSQKHHAQLMSEFRQHMADRDANVHDFLNYIQDNADYRAADGTLLTIPYQFDHSYSNARGEVILNSNPTFDPRGYGSGGWTLMQKTMHGN